MFSKPYSFVKSKKGKISMIAENGNFLEASMVRRLKKFKNVIPYPKPKASLRTRSSL